MALTATRFKDLHADSSQPGGASTPDRDGDASRTPDSCRVVRSRRPDHPAADFSYDEHTLVLLRGVDRGGESRGAAPRDDHVRKWKTFADGVETNFRPVRRCPARWRWVPSEDDLGMLPTPAVNPSRRVRSPRDVCSRSIQSNATRWFAQKILRPKTNSRGHHVAPMNG